VKYQHATLIVTTAVAANLRKLSQMLERSETDGMFVTPLSATGALPATHFISSGMVPKAYITNLSDPAKLKAAADAAYAAEGEVQPFTLTQITNALSKCTLSDGTFNDEPESPHAMIARLGLKMIQDTLS
jgi:hypothetical protein